MLVHHLPNPPPRYRTLADFVEQQGHPPYRFRQIMHAVTRGVLEFASMSELPRQLRDNLTAEFGSHVTTLQPLTSQRSAHVTKTLLASPKGGRVESVRLEYAAGWTSLCLSSQVGCGLGCTFCATGTMGLVRNLGADEIIDQVLLADGRPDSVAFMGMGEPLANPHTLAAIDLLTDASFLGFSPRRVTVSTVGFLPGMQQLVERHPGVVLTLSVHSPFDEQRSELIPLHHRYPLAECLDVLEEHVTVTNRRTYLAYLLIGGLNDSREHADALAARILARERPDLFMVSLIPFNQAPGLPAEFTPPEQHTVREFAQHLHARGVRATRRTQFGTDIDAACGQLAARHDAEI
ncbi:radical SAM protein [Actinobacteria bacterium YIM 96077]|uniref:Radical SAM core domain-containing protein n=1 Tax=Phytoactinopolyspora halophila TaxID=1981511 RepID=A0A329QMF7_9ACTN|nr:radical SAM protein [Phytoactinopolyspora halophila]AYY14837.1 radical SAM protein [Actinobacteria bacterium YIM 96077]RAW13111.1 hypothetical protein DPM12_13645 [Phytoactinopolyspora halophila]